jgi:ssDNA-binding Zn-finger/Zn-ribbon topoisomerase 1
MVLRNRREGSGKFIGCMGYPDCRNAVWFPGNVEAVELSGEFCSEVGDLFHMTHAQKLMSLLSIRHSCGMFYC